MRAQPKGRLIGKHWLPVALWMALIFLFSSQPNSGAITQQYFGNANLVLRKSAHVFEYFVLYLLSYRAFRNSGGFYFHCSSLLACALSFIYSISDEWHQSFVPGRSAGVSDVLVDGLGILTGLAFRALKAIVTFQKQ